MRLSPLEIVSRLNSSYWFVPLIVTLGGVGAALLVLDARVELPERGRLAVLLPSSAEGARALLSAVIGAMITAISVTFSVTIVALTVAAQHFGPRVLNNFVRQTGAQVVLGTFMATFAYSVLVLGAVPDTAADVDVPELAVAGAVVLVVISIGALIYHAHHVSTSLQIGEIAADIAADFRDAITRLEEHQEETDAPEPADIPDAPQRASAIPSLEAGYVQRIDYAPIVEAAAARDAVIWMRRETGAFVVAGAPLALVHPAAACDAEVMHAVRHACVVGRDRTLWQDPEFALKQLVEIALRALSPAVNEPFTATTCIDRLTEGLAALASAPTPRVSWPDAAGRPRVFAQPQDFSTLLHAAFDPIRIFAGPNPAVYTRLFESIAELVLMAKREADRIALRDLAEVIRRTAATALTDADDRTYVEERYEHSMQQFSGQATATRK